MSRWRRDNYWREFYPRSTPREAKGGIRAQSKRGGFGESWWARRWIEVLESFDIGARLGRGRSYARRGQVLSIDIGEGKVAAEVQGSRPKPYRVTIKVKTLAKAEWRKLAGELSKQAIYAAKLLAGEMPEDIEEVFRKAKLSLFPAKLRDLDTDCSCPDWSNPCKHIAAVYYLLGEEFDRDPFLIFRLRGTEREDLLRLLGSQTPPAEKAGRKTPGRRKKSEQAATVEPAEVDAIDESHEAETIPAQPLPTATAAFWQGGDVPEGFFGEVRVPPLAAALPRRLGSLSFWRAQTPLLESLAPIYGAASENAMGVFLGPQAQAVSLS